MTLGTPTRKFNILLIVLSPFLVILIIANYVFNLIKKFYNYIRIYKLWHEAKYSILIAAAVLIIDEINFPSKLLSMPSWIWIVTASGFFFILFLFIEKGVFPLLFRKYFNIWDQACFLGSISSLICLGYMYLGVNTRNWKTNILMILSVFFVSVFIIRSIFNMRTTEKKKKTNIIDLEKLYRDDYHELNYPLFFEDDDNINYDLLNHEFIVDELYHGIVNCQASNSFTFGLEGPWGSGKTTIINQVKERIFVNRKRNGVVLVDDFDPWLYGNQESLLVALYDSILRKMNIKIGKHQSRRLLNTLSSAISEAGNIGKVISGFVNFQNEEESTKAIREDIKVILKSRDTRYVVIIDNLDRADTDNILMVFKLIANFFDLPNIIYVLAYDKNRICSVLNANQIDTRYLDKIIHTSFQVPIFTYQQRVKVIKTCMHNLLLRTGISKVEIVEYNDIIDYIVEKVKDIRSFKRFLNSACNTVFTQEHYDKQSITTFISKRDLFAIETIRFFDNDLYNYIYTHSDYFTIHGLEIGPDDWSGYLMKFNRETKEAFVSLFNEKPDCIGILRCIFPTVQQYLINQTIYPADYMELERIYRENAIKMSIFHPEYFSLYFFSDKNTYTDIGIDVHSKIESLDKRYSDSFGIIPEGYEKEWFEQLKLQLDTIKPDLRLSAALSLIHTWNDITEDESSFVLSARDIAADIISDITKALDDEQFSSILRLLQKKYCYFSLIYRLIEKYRMKAPERQIQQIEELTRKMVDDVISSKINLFELPNYLYKNTLSFVQIANKMVPEEALNDYLHQIVNPNSVYRFLLEITDISIHGNQDSKKSTYYIYSIHPEILKLFSIDIKTIGEYLIANPPDGYACKYLRDLFGKIKDTQNGFDRSVEIKTTTAIDFWSVKHIYTEDDDMLF